MLKNQQFISVSCSEIIEMFEYLTQEKFTMKTNTPTLITALRILTNDIQSEDGVAKAAIAETADRLEELLISHNRYEKLRKFTPKDFKNLCLQNMKGEQCFDILVDNYNLTGH